MKFLSKFFKKAKDKIILGKGIPLKQIRNKYANIVNITINDKERTGHMAVFGSTGSGKTRLAEHIIEHDIKTFKKVLIFDPKTDYDLFAKVIQTCALTRRLKDLILFTPVFPKYSVRLNPTAYWHVPEEVVQHVCAPIAPPDLGQKSEMSESIFFYNIAVELLLAVVRSLQIIDVASGRKPFFNITRLNSFISFTDLHKLKAQIDEIASIKGDTPVGNTTIKEIVEKEISPKITQLLKSGEEHFAKVSGTLRTMLSRLTMGTTREIVADTVDNLLYQKLLNNEPVVFYCFTGSMVVRDMANMISKMLLSGILSIVGHYNSANKKFDPPLAIHIDEASNVMFAGLDDLFNKARGTNVMLTLYTQSLADFEVSMGRSYVQKMLDNINIQIYLRVGHLETAKYVSQKAGEIELFSPVLSMGGFSSARETKKKLIPENAATQIKPREFFAFIYDKSYFGYTIDVSPSLVKIDAPEIEFYKPTKN